MSAPELAKRTPLSSTPPVLELEGLRVDYRTRERARRVTVRAVDDVDLVVRAGETVGLVGESGCGKSSLVRAVLGLVPIAGGRVRLNGVELDADPRARRKATQRAVQMIFQDPYSSLNPGMTVGEIVAEPLRVNGMWDDTGRSRVDDLLELVGLNPDFRSRYPHQFSGGQRQRIGIARALVLEPQLLLLDEPVSALDVSVQAQIVNLLDDLARQLDTAMVFVSHDLSLVRHLCPRMYVMYLGKIVEAGPTRDLLDRPQHPYTSALVSAIPARTPESRTHRITLRGEIPSPLHPPSGCRFRTRCWRADDACHTEPVLGDGSRSAACHHPLEAGADSLD